MVLSKQITSSYQPLAAVMLSDPIYQTIADHTAKLGNLGHGFTGSGHPVAAAVALENLAIIEEQALVENAAAMGQVLRTELEKFSDHPLVGEVRGVGLIAAVQLIADKKTRRRFDPEGKLGAFIFERAHYHGLIVRNIKDAIAFCPPLIVNEAQVKEIATRFGKVLGDALDYAESNKMI
jgi:4-aminobutyrate--pyruvate transaminase